MIAYALDKQPKLTKHKKYFYSFECNRDNIQYLIFHGAGTLVDYQFTSKQLKWNEFLTQDLCIQYSIEAQTLQKIMKKFQKQILQSQILITTDNDRAGELIGWTIVEMLQNIVQSPIQGLMINIQQLPTCRQKFNKCIRAQKDISQRDLKYYIYVQRVRLNSLFDDVILNGIKNPQQFSYSSIDAEDLRTEIDLRVGYALSNLQRKFRAQILQNETKEEYKLPLTFGTCQIPTLGICYFENQDNIKQKDIHFKTEVYVKQLKNPLTSTPSNQIQQIILGETLVNKQTLKLEQIKNFKTEYPPNPLNTVRLQQHFNKYTANQVLKAAETLYNQGYITYPRTETEKFNNVDVFKIIQYMLKFKAFPEQIQYLNNFYQQNGSKTIIQEQIKRVNSNKRLQDDQSHTFLYVLKDLDQNSKLNQCCKDVYQYILTHFIASISENSITTTIQFKAPYQINEIQEDLTTSQSFLTTSGWKQILYNKQTEKSPDISQQYSLVEISSVQIKQIQNQHQQFKQSDLIGYMDRYRIGTDATIATHIEKIKDRNYVSKQLNVTDRGKQLVDFYTKINFNYITPTFRTMMEQMLKRVEYGYDTRESVKNCLLNDIQVFYQQILNKLQQ